LPIDRRLGEKSFFKKKPKKTKKKAMPKHRFLKRYKDAD